MIIASPAKKELAIQMQVLHQQQPQQQQQQQQQKQPQSQPHQAQQQAANHANVQIPLSTAAVSSTLCIPHEYDCEEHSHEDVIHFIQRNHRDHDFVSTVFHQLCGSVDELMRISVHHDSYRPVQCEAFIHEATAFLTFPVNERWTDGEFRSCITHMIELAEEKTGCEYLVIAIDRRSGTAEDHKLLRAFVHFGFRMIDPSVYGQEPGFVLVGYEL